MSRTAVLALGASLLAPPAAPPYLWAQDPADDPGMVQLEGRVLDAESGDGVPGVVIRLFGQPGRHVSGPDGEVSFEVPPGRYAFTAWKPGYATVESSIPVGIAGEFTLLMHRLGDVDLDVPARLVVRVGEYGSGRPVEGAAVSLQGGGARSTDARGMAEFTGLTEPAAELSVDMFGYAGRTEQVSLLLERTTVVQMALTVEAVALEPLEVEVRSRFLEARGVYWRIDHGRVQHLLTRETLDTLTVLTDGLKRLPGMRVEYYGGLPHVVGRRRCPLRVFLDGFALYPDNIDDVLPEEIEVAEIYLAERTPTQFGGIDNKCGAIVLWSRRKAGRGQQSVDNVPAQHRNHERRPPLSGLEAGTSAPDFSLLRVLGEDPVTLSQHRGEPVVLMFVPLAFSGVCTKEFCHVAENWRVWGSLGARVYGISIDSPFVNRKWGEEMGVPFPILSDFNKTAAAAYGVLREELAGLRGIADRSVFVVDADGCIRYSWVSEDPHVLPPFDDIVAAVRALA